MDDDFCNNITTQLKASIQIPPTYKDTVGDSGEILKWLTKNESLQKVIDGKYIWLIQNDE
jgi:hypothetical protein